MDILSHIYRMQGYSQRPGGGGGGLTTELVATSGSNDIRYPEL